MSGAEREVEIEAGWGLSMDLRENDLRPVKDIVEEQCTDGTKKTKAGKNRKRQDRISREIVSKCRRWKIRDI